MFLKKFIFSFLLFIFFSVSSHSGEGIHWSNYKSGPFNAEDAKKEFGNRLIDGIEGIWFDDGLGTVQIIKDPNEDDKYKMFIIDIEYSNSDDFNGTWEATFYQKDKKFLTYNFFTRVWYGSKGRRTFKTQSGHAQINAGTNVGVLIMDYDELSASGRQMDHSLRRLWPANYDAYNERIVKKYYLDESKKDANEVSKKNTPLNKTNNKSSNFKSYWWVVVLIGVGAFFVYMHTTNDLPQKKKINKKASATPGVLKKFFNGDVNLITSYWGVYFGIGLILGFISLALENDEEIAGLYSLFILLPFTIFAMIGTWRSASKYKILKQKKKEGTFWGTAAQVSIILSIISALVEIGRELN